MRLILLILFILIPASLIGQVTTSAKIEKTSFEYGEPLNITLTLFNGSDSTLFYEGTSSCQVELIISELGNYDYLCTADFYTYSINSNQSATLNIQIDPTLFYYPIENGVQTLIIGYLGFRDSVTFEAPAYLGGVLSVKYDSLNIDTVQQLRDSLSITETDAIFRNENDTLTSISSTWNFEDYQIDALAAQLDSSGFFIFTRFDRYYTTSNLTITSNNNEFLELPFSTKLFQNYPNPFNPTTTFTFKLSESGEVQFSIFNMIGQEVAILLNSKMSAGLHSINFDGSSLTSGTYFYSLKTTNKVFINKFTLIK